MSASSVDLDVCIVEDMLVDLISDLRRQTEEWRVDLVLLCAEMWSVCLHI